MTRIAMLALALLLGGCGGGKSDERDTAAGKILPGSASDAMLQTDRLQSEAPLAAPKLADDAKADATGAKAAGSPDEPERAEAPEAEAVAPAAEPAPQSAPPTSSTP